MIFYYGIDTLSLKKCELLLHGKMKGVINEEAKANILRCRENVEKMAIGDKAVYGINTGFGPLCETKVTPAETNTLQKNLLISHAVGVGKPIEKDISKLMLISKVHALSKGYSGVRFELVERIIFFIENDLIPVVPEQGSVGASGDLAPLSHLFLPLMGLGEFWKDGKEVSAASVHSDLGLKPLDLHAKEGLGLINGTQFILAHTIVALSKWKYLLDLADLAGVMSLEAYRGSAAPFREELHNIRPFEGSIIVAARIRKLLHKSQNLHSHEVCERVQDPYSLRCMPQVHGASRNAFLHLAQLAEVEMNAVTDNPIILDETTAISGGNFHGQPLAMALDYACVAASELGNISDRRCYLLLEGKYGLPRLLVAHSGLNSGLMIPQYTTAALTTENKTLCFPASADSIPTSLGQEDHVSMGSISGRKLNQILGNLEKILAIELLYAAQAMDFRRPLKFSEIVEHNHKLIRENVSHLKDDRLLKKDIAQLVKMVENKDFKLD